MIAVATVFIGLWAISVAVRDVSIVDPVWGPAFVVVALVCPLVGNGGAGRRWLLFG